MWMPRRLSTAKRSLLNLVLGFDKCRCQGFFCIVMLEVLASQLMFQSWSISLQASEEIAAICRHLDLKCEAGSPWLSLMYCQNVS